MHDNRHKAVVGATQFRALAPINAFLRHASPCLVNKARNRIPLDRKLRYPPRVNDIVCCDQEPDFRIGRDHQRLIDLEQVVVAFVSVL